ncbi:MAG: hypothetical protein A2146_03120 [Actinobacteria bacterium RBG_16_67_10]|nr:MAG: hypothetical protein A2146_03120 [Actinobacteria bacterium RBG_16_67_10]
MRFVAEDEVVRPTVELTPVACEPGVCLDRDRVVAWRVRALEHGGSEAVRVALGREVARELGDEEAAVREDQHAETASGLDEPGSGDGLSGGRRVAEAVPTDRAGIGSAEARLQVLLLDEAGVEVVVGLLVDLGLGHDAVAASIPVTVLFRRALCRGDELGEHSGKSVDLVTPKLGSCRRASRVLGEHALEPQHEPVANFPAG